MLLARRGVLLTGRLLHALLLLDGACLRFTLLRLLLHPGLLRGPLLLGTLLLVALLLFALLFGASLLVALLLGPLLLVALLFGALLFIALACLLTLPSLLLGTRLFIPLLRHACALLLLLLRLPLVALPRLDFALLRFPLAAGLRCRRLHGVLLSLPLALPSLFILGLHALRLPVRGPRPVLLRRSARRRGRRIALGMRKAGGRQLTRTQRCRPLGRRHAVRPVLRRARRADTGLSRHLPLRPLGRGFGRACRRTFPGRLPSRPSRCEALYVLHRWQRCGGFRLGGDDLHALRLLFCLCLLLPHLMQLRHWDGRAALFGDHPLARGEGHRPRRRRVPGDHRAIESPRRRGDGPFGRADRKARLGRGDAG
ncbi:MAG TPA: hypothetical protein VJ722_01010, partial [Rhodanobacteraceae bacterium]|nr:hypothetical protein [Rhodanobacteraceae bacterium]